VETVRKPYAFVGFGMSLDLLAPTDLGANQVADTFMSKTARLYQDTRMANATGSGLDKLNDDLQDVTRIMTKNMEELLWRGDSLDRACSLHFSYNSCLLTLACCRNVAHVGLSSVRL
jgi:vesicle transport protein SEC22